MEKRRSQKQKLRARSRARDHFAAISASPQLTSSRRAAYALAANILTMIVEHTK